MINILVYLYLDYHAEIYPALAHFCMTMRKGRRNKGGGTGYGRGYRPQTPPAAEDKPTLGNFLRVGLPERIFDELLFRVEHHFRDGLFRTVSMAVNTSSGRVKSVSRKQWMCIKRRGRCEDGVRAHTERGPFYHTEIKRALK